MGAPTGAVISIADAPAAPAQDPVGPPADAAAVDPAPVHNADGADAGAPGAAAIADAGAAGQPGAAADAGQALAAAAPMEIEAAGEPQQADEHQQEPAATFSDQTLVQKPAAVASPTVQCTGRKGHQLVASTPSCD